ncbi:hypothetical protein Tco_0295181 [Tanacetum coccineum]
MYEHASLDVTSTRRKRPQVDDQRLYLADDLKEAQDHISSTITSHKTKITTSNYDHDTHGHNRIISLRRGIKPSPQHITKNYETCGSNVHTTSDHNNIEWFKNREALQAKKAKSFKASKTESSNALRSKTPTKRGISINKEKDVNDLLRIFDKIGSSVNTPIMPPNMLGLDLNNKAVNESQYRGMIGPLMNLTASRPNIQFSTALCKTSSKHKESHLIFVENFQVTKCANKQQSEAMFSIKTEDIAAAAFKALKNSKVSFSIPTGGIFGEVGVNTFRNAIGAHYLPHSSEYVAPPSIDVVRQWFPMIGYREEVSAKGTLRKSLLPPSKEATKGGSSKAPTGSKTGHSKKRKESSSAMDSNPSQPIVSTPVYTRMSALHLLKPIFSASFIINSESASGCDALAYSIAKANPGLSANESIPQQQGMDEGTKNTSYDHIFIGTNPYVLADQTKSVSEGLETVPTQPIIGKGASSIARKVEEEEASSTIKLEDLAKLVSNVEPRFKDLDSPEDDPVIVVVDSDEDEEDEVHPTPNAETEDTSSQKHKLELEKNKAEAEAALLKAQTSFPNVEQLNELLVKSLKSEFLKILSEGEQLKWEAEKESTDNGRHIYLTEDEINHPKKLEEDAKDEAAKQEGEVRKAKLVDLLGPEVVKKKGPITLKVYREDGTSEIILNFKASDLHLVEWREVMKACPNRTRKGWEIHYEQCKQDPLDKLNDLANKKRKHAYDIHDYFKANKRLKSSVQYEDHLPGTVLNEPILASSVSALQVVRRLESIFTLVYAAVQKLKKDSWKELQFSLVDNSKLNVVYLLNRS